MENIEELNFIISREDCQKMINYNGCVCRRCGGELEPIQTVDNANNPTYWAGCVECRTYDNGVKPIIHRIAHELVTKRYYRAYHHQSEPDKTKDPLSHEYFLKSQIAGISSQVQEIIYLYTEMTAE